MRFLNDVRKRFGFGEHQINSDCSGLVSLKFIAVHREENDWSLRYNFAKLGRSLQAIHHGHGKVEND